MSMYTHLLSAALQGLNSSTDKLTNDEALAELLRCRNRLGTGLSHERSHRATDVVADELAYDTALIELARRVGLECDVGDFDNPGHGRALIERNLGTRGIRLGGLDGGTQTS